MKPSGLILSVASGLLLLADLGAAADGNSSNIITYNGTRYSCKCYEGDACWPSAPSWTALNASVNGLLQKVVPPAAVCYNSFDGQSYYNAKECTTVTNSWANETFHVNHPVSELWPYWTNNTCVPTTNPNGTCTLGYLPKYVIMATKKEHIKAGIDFARTNNIRVLIRNTGHDFLGRSTGYGSLAINTHSFKDISFTTSYSGPGSYRGGAAIVGAGIQSRELYGAAAKQNPPVVVVGGECPTVGWAGGYIQGGGHGPLATFYGMAADHVLSFDVVTTDGRFLTANEKENPDLYWALKGGGPSTFAVIISVTVKTHPELPTAGVVIDINSTHTTNDSLIWKAASLFHNRANYWVDHGMFVYYEVFPGSLHIRPFVGPNMTAEQITTVVKPLLDEFDAAKIPYSKIIKGYPTFYNLYIDLFEDESAGGSTLVGGRMFTRDDISKHGDEIMSAYKKIVAPDATAFQPIGFLIGHIVGPGHGNPDSDNAINPKWRNTTSFTITNVVVDPGRSWADKQKAQKYLTFDVDESLRKASPYGANYVNEGDLEEPNWQHEYWGNKYERLLATRKVWDPNGVLYTRTTPGTEDWEVIDYNTRLCKKAK